MNVAAGSRGKLLSKSDHPECAVVHKKHNTLFWTVTAMFIGGFYNFCMDETGKNAVIFSNLIAS